MLYTGKMPRFEILITDLIEKFMYSFKKNINRNIVVCVRCDDCGFLRNGWKDNVKINFRENVSVI